jgi:uncharacterized protein with von Willebrand factor type A (vWA) domain
MFLDFFYKLREARLPVSVQEYLTLIEALDKGVANFSVDDFYYLSRSILVKHEGMLDRYDRVFGEYFQGIMDMPTDDLLGLIPEDWLRKELQNHLSPEEIAKIEKLGGIEALMERFRQLLDEQKERHEGGNKWIGTGGSSPFGAFGSNPEGIRLGDAGGGAGGAVKIWGRRDFANLDDSVELNTRNIKIALKRLRHFTREGIPEELDIKDTIRKTSENAGMLEISMVPSRKNRVKVLMFFDAGGSMDGHVETCSQLFSAARYEFKHLEYYYFHNCIYENVWRDNRRRYEERIPTWDVLHKYNPDYKVIIVGDGAMSPTELAYKGGSIEHWNDEPGFTWLQRIKDQYPYLSWINPNPEYAWRYYDSTVMLRQFLQNRMFPMTLSGIRKTMQSLKDHTVTYEPAEARDN